MDEAVIIKSKAKIKWFKVMIDPMFIYLAIVANGLLFSTTIALHLIEAHRNPKINNFFDSLWWGVATITTIGYGDVVPITPAGRIIGIVLMITGPVLFVMFTGALWRSVLVEQVEREFRPIDKEIRRERRDSQQLDNVLQEISDRLKNLEDR